MSNDTTDFAGDVCRQLHDDGYSVHMGNTADGRELSGKHWFTWMKSGMSEAEVGPTCESELGAWSSALAHRIANSDIELSLVEGSAPQATMGPFLPARLPEAAFEVETIATRFGVTRDAAAAQVERLRRQSVYMNDLYQVNAQLVAAPFGAVAGDVMWLSIKRRDKAPVHDWRELQAVKNLIILISSVTQSPTQSVRGSAWVRKPIFARRCSARVRTSAGVCPTAAQCLE